MGKKKEDKKKKEEIEIRNNAESLVYNSQKTIDDLGDKLSGFLGFRACQLL